MTAAISIVITTYNREHYLGAAIDSILAQTWGDFELIVWDDGSTDGSVTIAQDYAKRDPRVRVIAAEHQGRGISLQRAIAKTTGSYIGWVDSDDWLAPTALAETAAILDTQPDVGMVYTDYLDIHESGKVIGYGQRCSVPYSKQRLLTNFMTFHFRLIRRSVFDRVGGIDFPAEYAEDYDLCLRLSETIEIAHISKPLYYYRSNPESLSYQNRVQQISHCHAAMRRALQRRGLSDRIEVALQTKGTGATMQARFALKRKTPLLSSTLKIAGLSLATLSGVAMIGQKIVQAQLITPANDGTGTIVTPSGNQINITGGSQSADGTNLFHSFEDFGVDNNQSANFISEPSINNILGKIIGGDPSIINGIIQVTGGNSNLFLMNPAGIVFGANSQLNVPASFTATTATSIGFNGGWLEAFASNDYTNLVGNPNSFRFETLQPGSIINMGDLAVPAASNLSLIGGTVLSTGTLITPEGNITIASVPGTSRLQINQAGQILSLQIEPPTTNQGNPTPITPQMLPQLLTGNGVDTNSDVTVTPEGQVQLTNSGTEVQTGDVAVNQINAGTATLSAQQNLILIESQLRTSEDMNLLANNTVFVRDSIENPFIAQAGGNLYIRGNLGIDILALNHLYQTPFVSGGDLTLVSDGIISGDAHFASGGSFSILNLLGNSGTFLSKKDPIISAIGDVIFGDYTGVSLKIEATGSISGGNITITDADFTLSESGDPDSGILSNQPALILRAGLDTLDNPPNVPVDAGETSFDSSGEPSSPGNVTVGDIAVGIFDFGEGVDHYGGPVIIEASGNITTGAIDSFNDGSGELDAGSVTLEAGGNIETENINSSGFFSNGGNVDLRADGTIKTGAINSSTEGFDPEGFDQVAGSVILEAGENIEFTTIDTSAIGQMISNATAGDVSIIANGVVQGTGLLGATNTTILTQASSELGGTIQNGSVEIQHNGGSENVPFVVGSLTTNSLAGSIDTGETSLPSGSFPVLPEGGDADDTPNGITITSVNSPPELTLNPTLPDTEENQPITFTFEDLQATLEDADGDTSLSIVIDQINAGTLTRNGVILEAGDTIEEGDTLVYTPPTDETGDISAFTIIGSDRVSFSEPQQVSINVDEPPTPIPPTPIPPTTPPIEIPPIEIPPTTPPTIPLTALIQNEVEEEIESFPVVQPIASNRLSTPIKSETEARQILSEIEQATGEKPALIYVSFAPTEISKNTNYTGLETNNTEAFDNYFNRSEPHVTITPQDSDQLELLIISAEEPPIRRRIGGVTRGQVLDVAQEFRRNVTSVRIPRDYLTPAKQLYQWLVAPVEEYLEAGEIDNLAFVMDEGLRSLPVAALHDGNGFIIERYSVGLMPTLSLTDTRYVDIRNVGVLAMGADTFEDLNPLPAVPLELSAIAGPLWQGKTFLNQDFTLENLKQIRSSQPFGIIHLATHGEFQSGKASNSYIQLWNQKLRLDQLRQLGLNNPPTELLVLSACRTALGDREAELGFAGLAIQAGVKSALGSLWYISDAGTLGFMTSFYEHLHQAPIKAEALRQTQLAMLKGEIRLEDKQLLVGDLRIPLNPELAKLPDQDFTHPYYWSALTLVGSPW
ncbi:CHAT domain-containing protein [Coleofasciculus sp. F4-SAH-05]|uniref:CHAT domain-containing protein n=1 Tax=Coleofasciculus sp. F4-SAH-05 TaxID=3069525 RepID=UPI0032F78BF9